MSRPPFHEVVVDEEVESLPFTRAFLGRVPAGTGVRLRPAGGEPPRGEGTVHVTRERGAFVKPCPCSPGAVRCGYWVLSPVYQCPFRCAYCFLRTYDPSTPLTLFANLEDAEREFREHLDSWPGRVRLGTGQFSDSLALDPWTDHSGWLRDLVRPHPRVTLELKTKSDRVERLLDRRPLPNVVVSWSLNPERRIRLDEAGSAPLAARLEAASALARAGYAVGFHFDPVVLEPGWYGEYRETARRLFEAVAPESIAWISLGTLRMSPRFLEEALASASLHPALFGELVPAPDGKLRYFWPLRRAAYRALAAALRGLGGADLPVYLCMESPEMWGAALGDVPQEDELVRRLLRRFD